MRVCSLWLWGYKITRIAEALRVNRRTITRDLESLKEWVKENPVNLKEIQDRNLRLLDQMVCEMKGEIDNVGDPEIKVQLIRKAADIPLELMRKLMPSEFRVEGLPLKPELTDEELDEKRERMKERVDHARNKK